MRLAEAPRSIALMEIPGASTPRIQRVAGAAAPTPVQTRPAPSKASTAAPGAYWVQVGAYRDADMARRVAQRLRERRYEVQESLVPRSGAAGASNSTATPISQGERDRYEIVVAGAAPAEVEAKLRSKGMTSRPVPEGLVITPALPLGEAVALSKDLADEGLSVRVRRTGAASAASTGPRAPESPAAETFYRVRVGGFADRTAAVAALKDLESLGYKPFLARDGE